MKNLNSVKLEMVEILAGQLYDQKISGFKIGKYPITQEQYKAVMETNPSNFKNNPQNPVEMVSWNDAQIFCEKLSQITGKTYRLPTEAEWEYACRAGTTTTYYFGDDASQLGDYAWYVRNSQGETHSVGQKKPNGWGLYDMYGNVWEWCQESCVRGGSWYSFPSRCLCGSKSLPDNRKDNDFGFRIVETINSINQ